MEHVCARTLLLITFSQLCRAALSETWYSANVINDGEYSPKPISEIFTSERPFSSTQPIVVLPPSSTPSAPLSTSENPTVYSSSFSTSAPTSATTPSPTPEYTTSTFTQTSFPPSSSFGTQSTHYPSTLPESKPTFEFRKPFVFPYPERQVPNSPNYFLIYQQVPQSVQTAYPTVPQQSETTYRTSSFQPTTFQPDLTAPQSTWSTFTTDGSPQPTSTVPPETTPSPSTPQATLATFYPSSDSTFSNKPSSFPNTSPTQSWQTMPGSPPCNTSKAGPTPYQQPPRYPTLRIRMVAPSGSITNINVNPVISTTTKRPSTRRTTTTRKPTTTRTRRTKKSKNNYDNCVESCGNKIPICATPLAVTPVDPDKLKGFPSVCHMACHNSFRKEQYQMLVEGRCGRLRTRIQTVHSDKIKRVELNKAQYTIVSNEPQEVVFLSDIDH